MQFTAIIALFAATTLALPASSPLQARSCDWLSCAEAIGPAGLACIAAAIAEGADPSKDTTCLTDLIKDFQNPPQACTACL
jgi:Fungal calcium binding protein